MSAIEIADAIVKEGLRPAIPDYVPEQVASLIQQCWAEDEEVRPTFDVLVTSLTEISKANLEPELPTEDIESASEGSRHNSVSVEPS